MPIEEQEVASIKEAVEKGEDISTNENIKKLSDLGLTIRTSATEKTFLDIEKQKVIDTEIAPKIKAVHDQYDTDIKNLYGIDRNQDEKTYEYLKRGASVKDAELQTLKTQIVDFEEKIKVGDPEGVWKAKLETAEATYKTELQNRDKTILEKDAEVVKSTKKRLLNEAISPIRANYKKNLPSYFKANEQLLVDAAMSNSTIIQDEKGNDILVLANGDGTPFKDSSFQMVTIESILKSDLKDAIDDGQKKDGPSSGGEGNNPDPSTITVDNFDMPISVKTKVDLTSHLMSLGIKQGSELFDKIYMKHGDNLKFR